MALTFRPLYTQVRQRLLKRLIDGRWSPGTQLPSEQWLASDLGVSQGTVRKALDSLVAENLLVRRQGLGTFVSIPEEGRLQFRFFRLMSDNGSRPHPESALCGVRKARADKSTRARLALPTGSMAWEIDRTRHLEGTPVIVERIKVPVSYFPDLGELEDIPNNLYALYSLRYGVTIGRAAEKLKASLADKAKAERLCCSIGTPLLAIDRIAYGLDGSPVEWRVSHCVTEEIHYFSDLQ
jgi:GntR family transcriptional regulator